MNSNYRKKEDENEDVYIYRICSLKDAIGDWKDVSDILNENLGYEYNESKYRKPFQYFNKLFDSLKENINVDFNDKEVSEQLIELKKEKIKVRDENNKYNQLIREQARMESFVERLVDAVNRTPRPLVPEYVGIKKENEKSGILSFGDCHIGKELRIYDLFGNILNEYNQDIFEQRMWELRDNVKHICEKERLSYINIVDLGDAIDGMLRISALSSLKYGSMDSAIIYAKFVSEWLNSISSFVSVKYYSVDGNHSETRPLGSKNGDFPHENLGKFIREYIKADLKNNNRVEVVIPFNAQKLYFEVSGYNIMVTHGEEKNKQNAVMEYENMYNVKINYLLGGHSHHSQNKEVGFDREYIGCGSIIGIDDYSVSLKRVSNPSAKFLVLEKDNGKIEYTIKL